MSKYIIGIDPDSKAHGIAYYEGGELDALFNFTLMQLHDYLLNGFEGEFSELEIHIEDVCANNKTFSKRFVANNYAQTTVTRSLGKCQQSQTELERMIEHIDEDKEIKIVKHKISKQWKKNKAQFEAVTKWKGRSNEDTRSAAYFGYLGL